MNACMHVLLRLCVCSQEYKCLFTYVFMLGSCAGLYIFVFRCVGGSAKDLMGVCIGVCTL